jgi:hypothetical protein
MKKYIFVFVIMIVAGCMILLCRAWNRAFADDIFQTLPFAEDISNMSSCGEGGLVYEAFFTTWGTPFLYVRLVPLKPLDQKIIYAELVLLDGSVVVCNVDNIAYTDREYGCMVLCPVEDETSIAQLSLGATERVQIRHLKSLGCK